MIIGICGGSGSGKTTLLKRLADHFKDVSPSIFSMDNYYLPIEHQVRDINGEVNFDLPTALDEARLTKDLEQLRAGNSIEVKEYHFNAPPSKNVLITLEPSELVIVEGLFLFEYEGVRNALDYSIFVDVDLKIQLDRRLYRDQETRGYSHESIMYQWNNHVMPCFEQFLFPHKDAADFIFNNDERADNDFEKLTLAIEELLAAKK